MTTAQKTWTAGDVLTAADMNTYARGGQEMGYAEITASSAAFTVVADVSGLSVTWTAISTRVYELEFFGNVVSTAGGDSIQVSITTSANTQVALGKSGSTVATFSSQLGVKRRVTGLSGSVTYKVRALRGGGATGTCTIEASATAPAYFIVKDIGAN
jgi:hypothetical protein